MKQDQPSTGCLSVFADVLRWLCVVSFWIFAAVMIFAVLVSSAKAADRDKFSMFFERVSLHQLVMVFYEQCEKKGLVFDPATNRLEEALTLKVESLSCSQARPIISDALFRAGVVLEVKATYDVLRLAPVVDERETWAQMIYVPRFREASELVDQVQIAVRKGYFAHQRRVVAMPAPSSPGQQAQQVQESGLNGASISSKPFDRLVFFGPPLEVKALESLLARLDVPVPQVEIRAGIFEFQGGRSSGSAVSAVAKLFSQRFGINVDGGSAAAGGASVKLSLPSLEAAFSVLDVDTRFRYLARPTVLARDGEPVRFFAGEDVRVVGAIVLDRNGNPLQSRETLSAGVTLEATPRVRADVVDLTLYQAVSNFFSSSAGDPSVLKRDLRSRLLMQPGVVYVIGGLQSSRRTEGQRRVFGARIASDDQSSETEIVLLLSVTPDRSSL